MLHLITIIEKFILCKKQDSVMKLDLYFYIIGIYAVLYQNWAGNTLINYVCDIKSVLIIHYMKGPSKRK